MEKQTLIFTIGLSIITIILFVIAITHPVNVDYISPIPTNEIVSPTISPVCTPTPVISSPTVTQVSPTPTVTTQIGSPESANNTQSAGASATVSYPTSPPDTGRVD